MCKCMLTEKLFLCDVWMCVGLQGETKVLKLKNLRPQDFANYTCQVSVRNVCGIPDSSVTFRLTNTTSEFPFKLKRSHSLSFPHYTAVVVSFAYAFCESHAFFYFAHFIAGKNELHM